MVASSSYSCMLEIIYSTIWITRPSIQCTAALSFCSIFKRDNCPFASSALSEIARIITNGISFKYCHETSLEFRHRIKYLSIANTLFAALNVSLIQFLSFCSDKLSHLIVSWIFIYRYFRCSFFNCFLCKFSWRRMQTYRK